ncbi:hypothetical protein D3C84_723870 [compost metagenome]
MEYPHPELECCRIGVARVAVTTVGVQIAYRATQHRSLRMTFSCIQHPAQGVRFPGVVAVEDGNKLAARLRYSAIEGIRDALVETRLPVVELVLMGRDLIQRAVGRAAVDDDDLQSLGFLRQYAGECSSEAKTVIFDDHDDAEGNAHRV